VRVVVRPRLSSSERQGAELSPCRGQREKAEALAPVALDEFGILRPALQLIRIGGDVRLLGLPGGSRRIVNQIKNHLLRRRKGLSTLQDVPAHDVGRRVIQYQGKHFKPQDLTKSSSQFVE